MTPFAPKVNLASNAEEGRLDRMNRIYRIKMRVAQPMIFRVNSCLLDRAVPDRTAFMRRHISSSQAAST
jgi:hypothetical protein